MASTPHRRGIEQRVSELVTTRLEGVGGWVYNKNILFIGQAVRIYISFALPVVHLGRRKSCDCERIWWKEKCGEWGYEREKNYQCWWRREEGRKLPLQLRFQLQSNNFRKCLPALPLVLGNTYRLRNASSRTPQTPQTALWRLNSRYKYTHTYTFFIGKATTQR